MEAASNSKISLDENSQNPTKGSVLIVDDQPEYIGMIVQWLIQDGYDVEMLEIDEIFTINDVLIRLEDEHQPRPNILLLDIMLPFENVSSFSEDESERCQDGISTGIVLAGKLKLLKLKTAIIFLTVRRGADAEIDSESKKLGIPVIEKVIQDKKKFLSLIADNSRRVHAP